MRRVDDEAASWTDSNRNSCLPEDRCSSVEIANGQRHTNHRAARRPWTGGVEVEVAPGKCDPELPRRVGRGVRLFAQAERLEEPPFGVERTRKPHTDECDRTVSMGEVFRPVGRRVVEGSEEYITERIGVRPREIRAVLLDWRSECPRPRRHFGRRTREEREEGRAITLSHRLLVIRRGPVNGARGGDELDFSAVRELDVTVQQAIRMRAPFLQRKPEPRVRAGGRVEIRDDDRNMVQANLERVRAAGTDSCGCCDHHGNGAEEEERDDARRSLWSHVTVRGAWAHDWRVE